MSPTFTLAGPGIHKNLVKIGQLVTDVWNPISLNYTPPYDGELVQPVITTRYQSKIRYKTDNEASVLVKLSKFFGIGGVRESSVVLKIEAAETGEQMMPNHAELFRELYCDPSILNPDELGKARTWIQTRMEEEKSIFMVVGVRTAKDARVAVEKAAESSTSFKVGIPVGEIASAIVPENALMIAAAAAQSKEAEEAHTLKGEWIIAVAYAKLKLANRRRRDSRHIPGSLRWEWYCGSMRLAVDPRIGRDPMDDFEVEAVVEDLDPSEFEDAEEDQDDEESVVGAKLDGVNFFF